MISQNKFLQIFAIIILTLLQVVIFSNINFLGSINPFIYILFILLLPLDTNRYLMLFYAFILGICIDVFEMTGGINAFATVLIAYLKPYLIKLINIGTIDDSDGVKLNRFNFFQWTIYLFVLIFIHHFTILSLERFNLDYIQQILKQTTIASLISFLLIGMYVIIFPPKRTNEF